MLFDDPKLLEKLEKLEYFVKSNPEFLDLPAQEQDLLEAQLGAMQAYLVVLKLRLREEKPEKPKKVTFTATYTITADLDCDAMAYHVLGQDFIAKVEEENMRSLGEEYFAFKKKRISCQVANIKIQ